MVSSRVSAAFPRKLNRNPKLEDFPIKNSKNGQPHYSMTHFPHVTGFPNDQKTPLLTLKLGTLDRN